MCVCVSVVTCAHSRKERESERETESEREREREREQRRERDLQSLRSPLLISYVLLFGPRFRSGSEVYDYSGDRAADKLFQFARDGIVASVFV